MPKIDRTDPGAILSKAVEYHGFVYLQGVTAKDTSKDIKGQTADVLAQIDQLLETHGTDKTRLLQALIWVRNIKDRDAMNEVWTPWLPKGGARRGPASKPSWRTPRSSSRSWSPPASRFHPLPGATVRRERSTFLKNPPAPCKLARQFARRLTKSGN